MSLTPEQRSLRSRMGAYAQWARTADRTARTKKARDKFDERFRREVDPDGTLPEEEREKRVAAARKEYFTRLAFKSSRARARGDRGSE